MMRRTPSPIQQHILIWRLLPACARRRGIISEIALYRYADEGESGGERTDPYKCFPGEQLANHVTGSSLRMLEQQWEDIARRDENRHSYIRSR